MQRVLSDGASAEHRDREERTPLLASLQPPIAASKSSTCLFGEGGRGARYGLRARGGGGAGARSAATQHACACNNGCSTCNQSIVGSDVTNTCYRYEGWGRARRAHG